MSLRITQEYIIRFVPQIQVDCLYIFIFKPRKNSKFEAWIIRQNVMEKKIIKVRHYESACGRLILGSMDDKLCMCDWMVEKHHDQVRRRLERMLCADFEEATSEIIEAAAVQLDEYFAGQRKMFDIPLFPAGTHFQKKVWSELMNIPYGKTISYCELAGKIGKPDAVRAVANANGANAISVFIPCHRVIGNDGSLTGYGGGLEAKRFLLELESPLLSDF